MRHSSSRCLQAGQRQRANSFIRFIRQRANSFIHCPRVFLQVPSRPSLEVFLLA
jgi:hypothetical protein